VPKISKCEYILIPEGFDLGEKLVIVKDTLNIRYNATHYTIAPAWDMMPLEEFKMALRDLANRLKQAYQKRV